MRSARNYRLTYQDYLDIRSAPYIRNACPVLTRDDLRAVSEFASAAGQITGIEPQFSEIRYLPLKQGRWLNDLDGAQKRNVIVLGEEMNRSAILAALAALAGVVIMVGLGSDGTLLGDGLAVAMTIAMAAMMIISRRAKGEDMLPAAALSSLLSALAVWPMADILSVHGMNWLLLTSFGLINSGLALACFTLGAQRIPPAETGLIGALDAPLAPLWVWLIVGETPTHPTLIGGAIVFAAVSAHLLASARQKPVSAH